MKNLSLIFLTSIFIFSLLTSCEKNPEPDKPDVVVTQKPSIEITITPVYDSIPIPYGTMVTIDWSAKYTYWITLNGESVDLKGSISNVRLLKDTLLSFNLSTTVSSVKKDTLIKVGSWELTDFGLLTHDVWYLKENKIQYYLTDDSVWYPFKWDTEWAYEIYYSFNTNGEYEESNFPAGGVLWSLEGDVIKIIRSDGYGGSNNKIISLTKTELVTQSHFDGSGGGASILMRSIYTHEKP